MIINKFNKLVNLLRNNNYTVKVTINKQDKFRFALVTGNNIKGGFATKSDYVYSQIDNAFCADHIDSFDKWSKCPLRMSLPLDGEILLEYLKVLGSEEGFRNSNSYDYLDNDLYPNKGTKPKLIYKLIDIISSKTKEQHVNLNWIKKDIEDKFNISFGKLEEWETYHNDILKYSTKFEDYIFILEIYKQNKKLFCREKFLNGESIDYYY